MQQEYNAQLKRMEEQQEILSLQQQAYADQQRQAEEDQARRIKQQQILTQQHALQTKTQQDDHNRRQATLDNRLSKAQSELKETQDRLWDLHDMEKNLDENKRRSTVTMQDDPDQATANPPPTSKIEYLVPPPLIMNQTIRPVGDLNRSMPAVSMVGAGQPSSSSTAVSSTSTSSAGGINGAGGILRLPPASSTLGPPGPPPLPPWPGGAGYQRDSDTPETTSSGGPTSSTPTAPQASTSNSTKTPVKLPLDSTEQTRASFNPDGPPRAVDKGWTAKSSEDIRKQLESYKNEMQDMRRDFDHAVRAFSNREETDAVDAATAPADGNSPSDAIAVIEEGQAENNTQLTDAVNHYHYALKNANRLGVAYVRQAEQNVQHSYGVAMSGGHAPVNPSKALLQLDPRLARVPPQMSTRPLSGLPMNHPGVANVPLAEGIYRRLPPVAMQIIGGQQQQGIPFMGGHERYEAQRHTANNVSIATAASLNMSAASVAGLPKETPVFNPSSQVGPLELPDALAPHVYKRFDKFDGKDFGRWLEDFYRTLRTENIYNQAHQRQLFIFCMKSKEAKDTLIVVESELGPNASVGELAEAFMQYLGITGLVETRLAKFEKMYQTEEQEIRHFKKQLKLAWFRNFHEEERVQYHRKLLSTFLKGLRHRIGTTIRPMMTANDIEEAYWRAADHEEWLKQSEPELFEKSETAAKDASTKGILRTKTVTIADEAPTEIAEVGAMEDQEVMVTSTVSGTGGKPPGSYVQLGADRRRIPSPSGKPATSPTRQIPKATPIVAATPVATTNIGNEALIQKLVETYMEKYDKLNERVMQALSQSMQSGPTARQSPQLSSPRAVSPSQRPRRLHPEADCDVDCTFCSGMGHMQKDCPSKKRWEQKSPSNRRSPSPRRYPQSNNSSPNTSASTSGTGTQPVKGGGGQTADPPGTASVLCAAWHPAFRPHTLDTDQVASVIDADRFVPDGFVMEYHQRVNDDGDVHLVDVGEKEDRKRLARLFIHVKLAGLKVKGFVDTGCDPNMIDADFYRRYLSEFPLEPAEVQLVTFNKTNIATIGRVFLPVDVGAYTIQMHEFQVVEDSRYPAVLGNSIMHGFDASLNYGRRTTMQGVPVESFHWDMEEQRYVEVEEDSALVAAAFEVAPRTVDNAELLLDTALFR